MKDYVKHYGELKRKLRILENQMPETMAGIEKMSRHKAAHGALGCKTKELIALGIAIYSGNSDCAVIHLQDVLDTNAQDQEILEAVEVSVMMGGIPAMVAGSEVLEALSDFRAHREPQLLFDSTLS